MWAFFPLHRGTAAPHCSEPPVTPQPTSSQQRLIAFALGGGLQRPINPSGEDRTMRLHSKWLALPVLAALVFSLGSAVYAQDVDYARRGAYFGAGAFLAFENFDDEIPGVPVDADDSWGLNARVGYRLHPHFAAELQYEWYDDFDIEVFGIKAAELDGWSLGVNGKGYLLTGRFQPYVLVGGGLLDVEIEDTLGLGLSEDEEAFMWRFGVGLDSYLVGEPGNMVLSIEAAYVLPTSDLDDFEFWTLGIGLQYRF